MELHSIKEKESLNLQVAVLWMDKWSDECKKCEKGVWQVKEEFCAWYKFVKTLNYLWSLTVTMTKWIIIASQWI